MLTEYNEDGSVGLLLNKPMNIKINELVFDFPMFESKVFLGGPVQTDSIHFLYYDGDLISDSLEIKDGIFWNGSFEELKENISEKKINKDDIRFYLGYSGWSANQLENEIKNGTWHVIDYDLKKIFKKDFNNLWKEIMEELGDKHSVFANFPDDPYLN